MSTHGEEFRAIRKQAGWTLEQVGAELGVSAAFIGQMERGQRPLHWITPTHASDLEDVMGIDPGGENGPIYHVCGRSAAETNPWVAHLWAKYAGEDLGNEGGER